MGTICDVKKIFVTKKLICDANFCFASQIVIFFAMLFLHRKYLPNFPRAKIFFGGFLFATYY